ncbi:MAG: sodium:proton antiporter [Gammaproteobacteria bacterium]|nr:sodium:proton antiporter [Gammaproteobacteria bacterium]
MPYTNTGYLKFALFLGLLGLSALVGNYVTPTWNVDAIELDVQRDANNQLFYIFREAPRYVSFTPQERSKLANNATSALNEDASIVEEFVIKTSAIGETSYWQYVVSRHWGFWSLLPALVAVLLCWLTREPITALLGGIISGAFILTEYDIFGGVLIQELGTTAAASVLILYLWLLGGLMGVWSRTGAAQAFAQYVTNHFVRGPRSAKLVAWGLGVIFFQGGTVSTVLVGTTVKPIADKERISHEELAYIVDSTASPIASQLAFNAWPGYVQAFIFVAGVSFLATEADRIAFFFSSVPFCFYAIFAVLGTFLVSVEKPLYLNKELRQAIERARSTNELDSPTAQVLAAKELQSSDVPAGYNPNLLEFVLPLVILIGIAIGTFIAFGSPNVHWAFGAALLFASIVALAKGMSLRDLIRGYETGFKGVVLGSVILLLALTIGAVSQMTGGGAYLVDLLGDALPYFLLPVILQVMTMTIAFSTGSSWGTYAVAFPLAMPLAWAIAEGADLSYPYLYMTLCFAAVMDGSVYGDQCSPISDTTVLSSVCTGCDLMDHVRTQIPQASVAAVLAGALWTLIAVFTA